METDERKTGELAAVSSTPWLAAVVLKHYQPINDEKAIREGDGAQQLNGQWYMPLFGCDTLAHLIEDIEYAAAKASNDPKLSDRGARRAGCEGDTKI